MLGHGTTSNRYEILARLASGGMAELFLARSTAIGDVVRYVVLKRVLPAYSNLPQYATMFLDEARIAAQLRHPNIVQLYDVGRLGSSHFYAMEYVHGDTVAALLQLVHASGRLIPLQHVLAIAAGTAAGLHHAHTRVGPDRRPLGIVHRDVSPANIMVSFDGVVKLLDFGVAKAVGRATETAAGTLKGKIAYLSPEQCRGAAIDGRSDLFSLGICIYELLTLHYLFNRANDLASIDAILCEAVPPPSALRRDLRPEVDHFVQKALAKEPGERFATADAMHEAIERVASHCGLTLSQTALGRYMRELFGDPVEPWLDPAISPVAVTGEVFGKIDPTAPIQLEPAGAILGRDPIDFDKLIENVHAVHDARELDEDTLDESPANIPALPPVSVHPAWEATTQRPLRAGASDQTARLARDREDFPSHVETLLDPRIVAREVTRPASRPRSASYPAPVQPTVRHATPVPNRAARPWPKPRRRASPASTWPWRLRRHLTRWNLPRNRIEIGLVAAIVIVLVAVVCLAVC